MSVKVKDRGANALLKRIDEIKNTTIRVGILTGKAEADHGNGLMTVDIAGFHEFGAGVPRRSWLRDWVDEQATEINKVLSTVGQLAAKEGAKAFEKGALKLASMCRDRIRKRIPPELSARTIARKGSSIPLIDKGILLTSVTADYTTKSGTSKVDPSG